MPNWISGYVEFTGSMENILSFITRGLEYLGTPIQAKVEGHHIIFSEDFTPWGLYVLGTSRAFVGFEQKHDLRTTDMPDIYSIGVSWEQAHEFKLAELSTIAKKYNLALEAEGIEDAIGFKQHFIINNLGKMVFGECIEYDREDYDPYDDYKKIR